MVNLPVAHQPRPPAARAFGVLKLDSRCSPACAPSSSATSCASRTRSPGSLRAWCAEIPGIDPPPRMFRSPYLWLPTVKAERSRTRRHHGTVGVLLRLVPAHRDAAAEADEDNITASMSAAS